MAGGGVDGGVSGGDREEFWIWGGAGGVSTDAGTRGGRWGGIWEMSDWRLMMIDGGEGGRQGIMVGGRST